MSTYARMERVKTEAVLTYRRLENVVARSALRDEAISKSLKLNAHNDTIRDSLNIPRRHPSSLANDLRQLFRNQLGAKPIVVYEVSLGIVVELGVTLKK